MHTQTYTQDEHTSASHAPATTVQQDSNGAGPSTQNDHISQTGGSGRKGPSSTQSDHISHAGGSGRSDGDILERLSMRALPHATACIVRLTEQVCTYIHSYTHTCMHACMYDTCYCMYREAD